MNLKNPELLYCINCGAEIDPDDVEVKKGIITTCPYCDGLTKQNSTVEESKINTFYHKILEELIDYVEVSLKHLKT